MKAMKKLSKPSDSSAKRRAKIAVAARKESMVKKPQKARTPPRKQPGKASTPPPKATNGPKPRSGDDFNTGRIITTHFGAFTPDELRQMKVDGRTVEDWLNIKREEMPETLKRFPTEIIHEVKAWFMKAFRGRDYAKLPKTK